MRLQHLMGKHQREMASTSIFSIDVKKTNNSKERFYF